MVDEDDENEGLIDEQEDLSRVLDYYEKKFKEKIGIMPAVVETDNIEMDLIVGMDSDQVIGMRLFQFIPVDEDDEKGNNGTNKEESSKKISKNDETEDDEDLDNDLYDVLVYDFTRSENAKVKIPGEPILEVEVGAPECDAGEDEEERVSKPKASEKKSSKASKAATEEKYWVHIAVFMKEDAEGAELSGAWLHYVEKPQTKIAFLPNPDLS
ncbi:MAG: hypothetical protein Q6373_023235 [Candidatus Sigynarchaeota archaeon]